jgi:hypothetical protein
MRKITLSEIEPQSDLIPRMSFNELQIARFQGDGCKICFSNSFGRSKCIVIHTPQNFSFPSLEIEYGFSISHIQFIFLNNDCSLFCKLE